MGEIPQRVRQVSPPPSREPVRRHVRDFKKFRRDAVRHRGARLEDVARDFERSDIQ